MNIILKVQGHCEDQMRYFCKSTEHRALHIVDNKGQLWLLNTTSQKYSHVPFLQKIRGWQLYMGHQNLFWKFTSPLNPKGWELLVILWMTQINFLYAGQIWLLQFLGVWVETWLLEAAWLLWHHGRPCMDGLRGSLYCRGGHFVRIFYGDSRAQVCSFLCEEPGCTRNWPCPLAVYSDRSVTT